MCRNMTKHTFILYAKILAVLGFKQGKKQIKGKKNLILELSDCHNKCDKLLIFQEFLILSSFY